jgi:hypothetical protein
MSKTSEMAEIMMLAKHAASRCYRRHIELLIEALAATLQDHGGPVNVVLGEEEVGEHADDLAREILDKDGDRMQSLVAGYLRTRGFEEDVIAAVCKINSEK